MKHIYTAFLFTFLSFFGFSQESIHAKILDSVTQKPIPFATISINDNSGVISNSNGDFQINLRGKFSKTDSLKIRCLGYQTKQFLAQNFKDSLVLMHTESIELDEILVSNKNYTPEEIIEKVKENLDNNYDHSFAKSKLFYRASSFQNLLKHDVKINKSTIPEFNQQFTDSLIAAIPKHADDYTEILANLYTTPDEDDKQKIDIIKASHLYDKSKELSFEGYEEKLNTILKKHVKRDSYFKIKSGFFGTKTEIDSTAFISDSEKKDVKKTEAMLEEEQKKEAERKKDFANYRKSAISKLEHDSFIFEDSDLNFLEKENRFDFIVEDYTFLNDEFVYKISFTPKRNEDFKGILYVNTDDFAIIRIDYENVKILKSFKLLGLSHTRNLKKGTLIYSKNDTEKYTLKYAELEEGSKFGIDRPLTIIEKNKHVKGRRKQNELDSDIHFIMSIRQKSELVIFENEQISETDFNNFEEKPNVEPVYLPKYDPEFWKGYNVIEPNAAIKAFKTIE
ncbi:carboxypeptidase-like regulatory domain-containing protein [Algibacter miyuki]|uniref:Carboxypeptidase-like regulatory domain-containing protein n=1 Tax=Algibacter miyuki TaxID=1306933 RepID=A0ABV5H192_9FLAO|nr:carboxypeptidase-like regulatory domain-containing protein [Algibacter miyuki]MDN3666277.1 carboxypeptidase-like regulatory domain-containing protein [Algibacter miyuki]